MFMPGKMSGLRYPAALDLPSEPTSGKEFADTDTYEEPGAVSIDRRLFRRLKRPGSRPERKVGQNAEHFGYGGSDALYTFGPSACKSDEDWLATTSYGSYDRDEDDGAAAVRLGGRQRLAGNNLEVFDDFLDDHFADGNRGELETPWDEDIETWVQPSRSMSSPDLRMQQQHQKPRCMQPQECLGLKDQRCPERYQCNAYPSEHRYAEYDIPLERPPWQDPAPYYDAAWLTPERRKPRTKSDPVSRGAQLRGLWQRDRFLRSSPARKFDLRGCGGSQTFEVSAHRSRGYIPSYVPPHEKRRDDVRLQVRLQMRESDF